MEEPTPTVPLDRTYLGRQKILFSFSFDTIENQDVRGRKDYRDKLVPYVSVTVMHMSESYLKFLQLPRRVVHQTRPDTGWPSELLKSRRRQMTFTFGRLLSEAAG